MKLTHEELNIILEALNAYTTALQGQPRTQTKIRKIGILIRYLNQVQL